MKLAKSWPTIAAVFIGGGFTALGSEGVMDPTLAGSIVTVVVAGLTRLAHHLDSR